MRWMVPINDLDAVQLRTIENILSDRDRNHWVKGFAGSGKTIVLTHVLERLATAKPSVKVCFATYTHALKDMVESGLSDEAKRKLDISTFHGLRQLRNQYDIVVADEMQDITPALLPTLAKKSGVLIIAADTDQSIYRGACTVNQLNAAVKPAKEHQLREIFRINENVFDIATSVNSNVTVVSKTMVRQDDQRAYLYKGVSMRDEFITMYEEAVRVSAKESPSAILLPSKALIDEFIETVAVANDYSGTPPSVRDTTRNSDGSFGVKYEETNKYLKKNKSPLQVFGGGGGDLYETDFRKMILLMTYHSAKGLDFANVFLPHLTDSVSLEPMKGATDEQERRLFFVATTRAREGLYLSYHGEPHRFIDDIPEDLLQPFRKKKRNY